MITQEDKELLFNDLCARLLYKPLISAPAFSKNPVFLKGIEVSDDGYNDYQIYVEGIGNLFVSADDIKPYLRPMSSMTEDERMFVNKTFFSESDNFMIDDVGEMFTESQPYETIYTLSLKIQSEYFNWLNANFFDYRGLIKKGLAIEISTADKNKEQ